MSDTKHRASIGEVELAYYDLAPNGSSSTNRETRIILLIHGFASSAQINWISTGWSDVLRDAGYRVIALDNRGHGDSSKFYSPDDYGPDIFANDAFGLLDYLGVELCDVMGFSMGTRITCWMAHQNPSRIRRAIFGGMGSYIFGNRGGYEEIAQALEIDDPDTIEDKRAASFRKFADHMGADKRALAACIRPSKKRITEDMVAAVTTPVLVAVGSEDEIGGSAEELAAMMPHAQAFVIEGLDHMKSTGAASFKKKVLEFLNE
ncbi:MAG: alpha/beta hydrolase [Rhizobiaceae bacterium]